MPIRVVTGPPFAGKDKAVDRVRQPGQPVLDSTPMWRTMFHPEAGAERTMDQARVVQAGEARCSRQGG